MTATNMPANPPHLLERVEALRSLMPKAEELLSQVADYIQAAEKTASDLGNDDHRLREERARLQEEREEVEALRQQLLDARSEFEQGALRHETEMEELRARLAAVCDMLGQREQERDTLSATFETELRQAQERVRELEERSIPRVEEPSTPPVLERLRALELELSRTREERSRMLDIIAPAKPQPCT